MSLCQFIFLSRTHLLIFSFNYVHNINIKKNVCLYINNHNFTFRKYTPFYLYKGMNNENTNLPIYYYHLDLLTLKYLLAFRNL